MQRSDDVQSTGLVTSTIFNTHISLWMRERERNVLFNDPLTHFIYGYMASDIWLRTILIVRKEREREMFYLTTDSTHFIYGYMASDIWLRTILIVRKEKERNVLFNDTLNTFYLWLYGVRHMVKDHSDSE